MTAIGKATRALRLARWIVLGAGFLAAAAEAQPVATRTASLDAALRTLAQNPQSTAALTAAGEASLELDDVDAAAGFFRRAQALDPQDPRVNAGLAAVLVRQRQPLEALRLFAQAEQGGALSVPYLAERGLAYDLVGDNARAQRDYMTALAAGPDPAISRRLALSQAIAGDQRGSEATLLPLLQQQDLAAYRTRAFSLAILGRGDEAVSIAETMLPANLSGRMAPYLRYMPRLTRAQQAAAADLGAFPAAGDIGRDDPAVVAYAASLGAAPPRPQSPDSRLVPSGPPLGSGVAVRQRQVRAAVPVPAPAATPPPVAVAVAGPAPAAAQPAPQQRSAAPALRPDASARLPERARAMLLEHPELASSAIAAPPTRAAPPRAATAPEPPPQPVVVAEADPVPQPVVVAREETLSAPPVAASPVPVPPPAAPAAESLRDAFADLRTPAAPPLAGPASGAVDITRIQPRRDSPKPPAPPKPPPAPSRQWVQVATGRDTRALAFDWRRIKREAGSLMARQAPSTAKWGQTNRLLIGPFASTDAADAMVDKLKDRKLDAFRFTSDEGQEVKPLPGA